MIVAYAMNGEDLPWLNGFSLRLVVPGRYGTYWLKHLGTIAVLDAPARQFLDEVGLPHPQQRLCLQDPDRAPRARRQSVD